MAKAKSPNRIFYSAIIREFFAKNPGLEIFTNDLLEMIAGKCDGYQPNRNSLLTIMNRLIREDFPLKKLSTDSWSYRPNPVDNKGAKQPELIQPVKLDSSYYYERLHGPSEKGRVVLRDEDGTIHLAQLVSIDEVAY